jgi:hypothetical protein
MANVRSGTRGQELPNVSASNGAQAAAPGHMPGTFSSSILFRCALDTDVDGTATNAQAGQTGEPPDARDAERVRTNSPITSYTGSAYTTVGGPYFHPITHSNPLLSRQNMSRALREVEPAFATADAAHVDYNNVRHVYPHLTIGKIYDDLEWQKDAGLMDQKTHNLITGVCGCSAEIWHEPSNVHEWRSGLRYNAWDGASGEWKLAEEWMRIFALRPDYLELAPPDVQDAFEAMQQPRRKKKHSTTQVSLGAWVTKRLADLDLEMTSTWEAANVALDLHVAQLAVGAAGTHHNFDSEPAAEILTDINLRKRSRDDWDVDKNSSVGSSLQKRVARPGQINAPQTTGYALIPQPQTFHPKSALANCYPTQPHVLLAKVAVPQMPAPPVHIPLNLTPPPALVLTPQPIRSGQLSGLRPSNGSGPWEYEWSTGRKRIFLETTHIGQVLPPEATPQHDNFFSSYCTSEHVDLRHLGHLDITITEILTVRILLLHARLTLLNPLQFFPDHLKWRAVAQRLRIAGWTAGKARQFIVSAYSPAIVT